MITESNNNYKLLYDNLPMGIIVFDKNLIVTDCNKYLLKILSLEPDNKLIGFDFTKFSDKRIIAAFEAAISGVEGFFEGQLSSKKMRDVSLKIQTKPVFVNAQNIKPEFGLAIIEDITDQKIVEDAINKSFNTFQTVLDNVDSLLYALDSKTYDILFINSKAAYELNDIFEKEQYKISDKEKCKIFIDNNIPQEGKTCEYEYYNKNANKWYKCSNSYIKWIDTREVYLVCATDITLLKQIQEQIKGKNLELNEALKTVIEQNEKINKQSESIKHTSQIKDKMLSIIGHDVRGPLGNIRNVLTLLMEDYDNYSKHDIVGFIEPVIDTAASAFNLLSNLLFWARNQSGKVVCSPAFFIINELIDENISLFAINIEKKNIGLKLDIDKNYQVFADENMINTVIRNLISNAIKFTPFAGKVIIKLEKISNQIEFSVKDSGLGISKENIKKILVTKEIFTNYGTNNEKGSGLGLTLCREFLERHGSNLIIESEISKGSKFSFTLPELRNI